MNGDMRSGMESGFTTFDEYLEGLPECERKEIEAGSAQMIKDGLPRHDGFAHYVMYTDEQGETKTICLYIGITRKENVADAIVNIRGALGLFTSYPPETEWGHPPDEETQSRCIEAWRQVNADKAYQFGILEFTSI
ncbi:hypothetical protein Galf_1952 [Gallionella capsiferriformans ES-2]|uniref:Uncharacterized protein n=2 Tax=Gallionella TaxID=96 RepID=D9SHG1_GALCS|nr:hypothetical protein Galf_1952 [Gallionella capsiferriformans ES-2]